MTDEQVRALLLRLPPELHRDLRRLAGLDRRSINSEILVLVARGIESAKRQKRWQEGAA